MSLLKSRFSSAALDAARHSYAEGLKRSGPRLPNMERRQSARYVADLSRRLSTEEIKTLAEATQLREESLVLARSGKAPEARRLLGEAAQLVATRVGTREGRTSADSFHAAAASFVDYVEGHYESAIEEMQEALRHCRTLGVEFGHSVALRRIHLGRNVARLVWSLGRHDDAAAMCAALVAYTWGESLWPLDEETDTDKEVAGSLRTDERVFLTDQLMSEVVSVCNNAREHRLQMCPVDIRDYRDANFDFPERALCAQRVCAYIPSDDLEAILEAAATYFEGGSGNMPITWRRIVRLVEDETGEPLSAA